MKKDVIMYMIIQRTRGSAIVYQEHERFIIPQEHMKLWRYMDLSKFIYLLSGKLFFSRMNKFEDNFEVTYPKYNLEMRPVVYKGILDDVQVQNLSNSLEKISEKIKMKSYACCWHINDYESAAMWKLYLSSNEGIAIQTNVSKLIESLKQEVKHIYIGKVNYIDYNSEYLPEDNLLNLLLYKRKSFEHERELRCIYTALFDDDRDIPGVDISIDLTELIEKIYISPTAPAYFKKIVEDVIEKYGYEFEVTQSTMYSGLY